MTDNIEFIRDWFAEVQDKGSPGRLRQVAFRKGTKLLAQVRPIDRSNGKLADLCLPNGTTALQVPVSQFVVIRQHSRAA